MYRPGDASHRRPCASPGSAELDRRLGDLAEHIRSSRLPIIGMKALGENAEDAVKPFRVGVGLI